jgi:hypothetical protein
MELVGSTKAIVAGETPSIVLAVRIWVSLVPTIAPVGAATLPVKVVALPAMGICVAVKPEILLLPAFAITNASVATLVVLSAAA